MTTRICKRGHTDLIYSRDAERVLKAKAERMKRISESDLAVIKARAKDTADKAKALAMSKIQLQQTTPAPVYVDTGMGYSVRRYYP